MSFIRDFEIKSACLLSTLEYARRTDHLTTEQRIALYEECFKMAADLGWTDTKIRLCDFLSRLHFSCSHYRESIKYLEIVADNEIEGRERGDVLEDIGYCYYLLGQFDQAIAQYEMHLNITKQTNAKKKKSGACINLGCCYYSLGQYDKAVEYHEMGLAIAKEIGYKEGEGGAYGNLGNCYNSLGQHEKALIYHEKHLEIAKELGDKQGERNACGNIGCCLRSLGKYDRAIQFLEKDLSIAKETGNIVGQAGTLCNLGNCYTCLGHYDKAIEYHHMALNLAEKVGDKANEAAAYANLGNCYWSLGKYDIAILYHKMHLRITKHIGNKAGEGISYGNLGVCYRELEQYDNAIQYLERHLHVAKQIEDKAGGGRAYANLGNCYLDTGQYEKAIDHFQMSLAIYNENKDKFSEGIAYCNLASTFLHLKRYDRAVDYAEKSIQCYEELFQNVPKKDQLKISIRDKFAYAYIVLTRALFGRHNTDEALVAVERGRCRALAELMIFNYHTECNEETAVKLFDVKEIFDIVHKIGNPVIYFFIYWSEVNAWVIHPNGSMEFHQTNTTKFCGSTKDNSCKTLTETSVFFEKELKLLIKKACTAQRLVCSRECEDRSLSSLLSNTNEMTKLNRIDFGFSLNEFSSLVSLNKEKTKYTVFSEHRNIETTEQDDFKAPLQDDNPRKTLYQLLLAPIRHHFEEASQIVIVTEGLLNLVPFATLMDEDGRYLSEWLQVRLFPSLATAKMILESPQKTDIQSTPLIVGDPDASRLAPRLPCANEEAVMISRLFGVQPLTGKDATKERFLSNISYANLIHIAAHGDMKRGEILLAVQPRDEIKKEDFMVMISDLQNIRVMAKLVVLSCCNSAHGEIRAEGVIGIARAFLGAGARSVLVALWAINDAATLYFMKEFYEHLTKGKKVNESLNRAMKSMRDSKEFCDPWHWAPFVLIGDNVSLF